MSGPKTGSRPGNLPQKPDPLASSTQSQPPEATRPPDLPVPSSQSARPKLEEARKAEHQQATASVRVLIAEKKVIPPRAEVLKVFQEHCPQIGITMEKEKANYFVTFDLAGLRHSKNEVIVVSNGGSLIHSGTTFTLANAAKDACSAILQDIKAKTGQ